MGKQKPRKRWYIVFMLVISIVIMICLFSGSNFVEQANKPLTMKTITVCLESSNEPYEKEELYSFQWQGDSIAPVNSVEEAAKAAEQLWNVVFDYDIETKRPFIVSYDETNKIWLIKGSMRELKGGGVPYALITIDGKVLAIWHTR